MDYNILNINRNASNEDIRKAYYKLARIYHPDKNPGDKQSEQKFKEINGAYENIINGKSRDERTFFYSFTNISFPPELVKFAEKILQSDGGKTIYDKVCKISSIIQTGIPSEIHNYKNFYDNFNDKLNQNKDQHNTNNKNNKNKNIQSKTDDIDINVNIKIEDIYNNIYKKINIKLYRKCIICDGNGFITTIKKKLCPECNGTMVYLKSVEFSFYSNEKEKIFIGQSNEELNKIPGDVIITVSPKEDIYFKLVNTNDLLIEENVSLYEVYNGYSFYFTHLDKKRYHINYTKPIINKKLKKIVNKGMPIKKDNWGNLYVKFNIILPNITPNQLDIINRMNLSIHKHHLFDEFDDTYENAEIIYPNLLN